MRHANVALLGALLLTSQLALADDPPAAAPASPPAQSVETPRAEPPAPNEDEAGPRPSMRYEARPDEFPMPPTEMTTNPIAPVTFESNGVKLFVDPLSFQYLEDTEIDYVEGVHGSGFKFNNPQVTGSCGCGSSVKF